MPPLLQSLTSLTAIIGPAVTLIGLIQSRGWLAGIGTFFVCVSMIAFLYARSQTRRLLSATVEIEGISIDSLNAANLPRRVSSQFFIQSVEHLVTVEDSDLHLRWRYAGYCRASEASAFQFSVDADAGIPFPTLECSGFDLEVDPERQHRIQPMLIGPDGISKKISVPFLQPLRANQPFDVMLDCRLPGVFRQNGTTYYTSTMSFDQQTVADCRVELVFLGSRPEWVRVYECAADRAPQLLRTLMPEREDRESSRFVDVSRNRPAQSARVYLFRRK